MTYKAKAIIRFFYCEFIHTGFLAWLNWYWIHVLPFGFTFFGVYLLIYPLWALGTLLNGYGWSLWLDKQIYYKEWKGKYPWLRK